MGIPPTPGPATACAAGDRASEPLVRARAAGAQEGVAAGTTAAGLRPRPARRPGEGPIGKRLAGIAAPAVIELDDQVFATDPETGDTTSEPVEALFDDLDLGLADVTVTLPDGTSTVIKTTANHPFWDQTTKAWTDAGYLTAGDQLQSINGRTITVHAVRLHQGPQHRFNLTITSKHTYYVLAGNTPVLVHKLQSAGRLCR